MIHHLLRLNIHWVIWALELDYQMVGISRSFLQLLCHPCQPCADVSDTLRHLRQDQMSAFKQRNCTLDLQWKLRCVACR